MNDYTNELQRYLDFYDRNFAHDFSGPAGAQNQATYQGARMMFARQLADQQQRGASNAGGNFFGGDSNPAANAQFTPGQYTAPQRVPMMQMPEYNPRSNFLAQLIGKR